VKNGAVFVIKSPLILLPGPAALTDGLAAIETIFTQATVKPPRAAAETPANS
jgi:hypothetical protein